MAWDIGADEVFAGDTVSPASTTHNHTADQVQVFEPSSQPGWDIGADEWDGYVAGLVKVVHETVRT